MGKFYKRLFAFYLGSNKRLDKFALFSRAWYNNFVMGKSEYTKKRDQAPLQLSKGEALDKTAPENKASAFAAPETPCPDIQDEPKENGTARAGIGEKIAAAFRGGDKLRGSSRRIWELDFVRGVCVLLMIFDHFIYDIGHIFAPAWIRANPDMEPLRYMRDMALDYWNSSFHETSQHIVVWIFCFVCGISCYFSRSNLKRGIMAGIFAMLITVVTEQLDMTIRFGILHMFAVAILLWWLIDTLCRHNKLRTATVSLVLGVAIIAINYGFSAAYENGARFTDSETWFFVADWLNAGVYSADYYPIFPSVGYVLIGSFFGYVLYNKRRSLLPRLGKYSWHAPFDFWGRIALWVYVFHQVVVAAVLAIVSVIFFTPGDLVII